MTDNFSDGDWLPAYAATIDAALDPAEPLRAVLPQSELESLTARCHDQLAVPSQTSTLTLPVGSHSGLI